MEAALIIIIGLVRQRVDKLKTLTHNYKQCVLQRAVMCGSLLPCITGSLCAPSSRKYWLDWWGCGAT